MTKMTDYHLVVAAPDSNEAMQLVHAKKGCNKMFDIDDATRLSVLVETVHRHSLVCKVH